MKSDRTHLEHARECLEWIARFTASGPKEFLEDRKTRSAVLRELQTLAESCRQLTSSLKIRHPEVFWQGISGFRTVLARDHMGVGPERVWSVIESDLPVLRHAVETMLEETGGAP